MPLAVKLNNQQLREFEELQDDDFEGFEVGDERPLITDGIYKARCIKIEDLNYYGQWKVTFTFQIIESGQYEGIELKMYAPKYQKYPAGSKYYQQWVIANNGINPSRKRITPLIFKNRVFAVVVKTVIPKNKYAPKYSIIETLKECIN